MYFSPKGDAAATASIRTESLNVGAKRGPSLRGGLQLGGAPQGAMGASATSYISRGRDSLRDPSFTSSGGGGLEGGGSVGQSSLPNTPSGARGVSPNSMGSSMGGHPGGDPGGSQTGSQDQASSASLGGGGGGKLVEVPPAASALLRHQHLKEQLLESLSYHQERLSTLVETAKVEMESQEEHIKRSVINRKIIFSLRGQVKEQKKRRDRLLQQQRTQQHAVLRTMSGQVESQSAEIERLERELAQKQATKAFKLKKLAALRGEVDAAKEKSENIWRSGNRVLAAPKTQAEVRSNVEGTERSNWLETLKGGTNRYTQRLGTFESGVLRKRNANEFLKISKERSEFYEGEYSDPDGNADAHERLIKEVHVISAVAEQFLDKQRRAIAEVRYIQGLSQLDGSPLSKWDQNTTNNVATAAGGSGAKGGEEKSQCPPGDDNPKEDEEGEKATSSEGPKTPQKQTSSSAFLEQTSSSAVVGEKPITPSGSKTLTPESPVASLGALLNPSSAAALLLHKSTSGGGGGVQKEPSTSSTE